MGRLTGRAWADADCQTEPVKSIDDMVDPEAGTLIAIFESSH